MAKAIVQSADQYGIETAKAAAGAGGVVIFPPGAYSVEGLEFDIPQFWEFERGASLVRSSASVKPILSIKENAEISGGVFDANGGTFTPSKPFAIHSIGKSLTWANGLLRNSPAWGIQMDDADLVLDHTTFRNLAYAAVHWRAMTPLSSTPGDYREGPKIRNCRIERRVGYVSSGGILVNSGGGTSSAFRAIVEGCDIVMPIGTIDHSVGCEFNSVQLGGMINNTLDGSRIGFSTGNCSGVVMSGNRSKNIGNYAHELVGSEWGVVTGNTATGVAGTLSGCELSGSSRSNVVANNTFRQGFPVPVRDQSVAVAGYPSFISGNL